MVSDYQEEISMLFDYNIDTIEQHPSSVCHKDDGIDPVQKKHEQTAMTAMAIFLPHSTACNLCKFQRLTKYNFQLEQLKVFTFLC